MGGREYKKWLKKYYMVLEWGIPKDFTEFSFIRICSEKKPNDPVVGLNKYYY